jgi:hypothetical protein
MFICASDSDLIKMRTFDGHPESPLRFIASGLELCQGTMDEMDGNGSLAHCRGNALHVA